MLYAMKLKNFDQLVGSDLRKQGLLILEAGLAAIDTETVIRNTVKLEPGVLIAGDTRHELSDSARVFFVGVGKCAVEGGRAIEGILGERLADGIVLDIKKETSFAKLRYYEATHPMPSEANMRGTDAIVSLLRNAGKEDIVLFLISGGGSTMLCMPEERNYEDEVAILAALVAAGANIKEVNTVRKHLSKARAGHLAEFAYPARSVALIFSDVPGDDIQFIASGPTVRDETTVADADAVLTRYHVAETCNLPNIRLIETPKSDIYFEKTTNMIAVSNLTALRAMEEKAKELGFRPQTVDAHIEGEAKEVAKTIIEKLHKQRSKAVLLYGGETTVTGAGEGKGGRNQELALAALGGVIEGELLISVASDGHDNGEYMGAICDTITLAHASQAGIAPQEFLKAHNSTPFFERTGDALMSGPTGSNVSDLMLAMKK